MKKLIYFLTLGVALASCNKFLDVKPQSQIDREELFRTEQGFQEALNGVYTVCTSTSLYGANLTFIDDILSQNYQFNDVVMQQMANFNYTLPTVVSRNYDIWATGYKAIANCNYLLEKVDDPKVSFSGTNRQLIKGEALALRAYLHFDLLRNFAPSYVTGASKNGIPYVTTVDVRSTPFSTVEKDIEKIIADLNEAKALLKTDPIIAAGYKVGYQQNSKIDTLSNKADTIYKIGTEVSVNNLFLQNRRHRLNYYSVCGELARVYLYKNDNTNALINAKEVIESKKFPFTNRQILIAPDVEKRDRILYPELISAWYIDTQTENDLLNNYYSSQTPVFSGTIDQVRDIYEVGGVGAEDDRFKIWFVSAASTQGGPNRAIFQKYKRNPSPQINLHPLVAPAIRLSEMYYIAAEASFDANPTDALKYYNTLRARRGIDATVTTVPSKADFINRLLTDARKEFYGETQLFYMYKRLNHAVVVSSTQTVQPSDKIFVFPIPPDELTYRNN